MDGVSMRRLCALVLACSLWLLPSSLNGGGAADAAELARPSPAPEARSVREAKFVCGLSGCTYVPGGGVEHGKNATPGLIDVNPKDDAPEEEAVKPGEHSCPPGYRVLAVPTQSGYCALAETPAGAPAAAATPCQHGMVGAPPACHCPKDSELLGGNCVHYAARCSNGLAANINPQPCPGEDEKLACKLRNDGLKDCCCLTYDKM
jgi:hypothetical protein